jgi:hypothetical protein
MPLIINREKLAYAAGLYDGEGHCRYNILKRDGMRTIRLQIKMTDPEPLKRFWEAINYKAKVYGPYPVSSWGKKYKDVYLILAQSFEECQFIMCLLWSWLSTPKKLQFKETLNFYHNHGKVAV